MMQPFIRMTGVAVPLFEDDVNTDQIAPVGGGPKLSQNYAEVLFSNRRNGRNGTPDPDFVFNKPQFAAPSILATGRNFGCGSSRESAVWALTAIGVRCIIARSFADIYRENCLVNGVLPVVLAEGDADAFEARVMAADGHAFFTADLAQQMIVCPDGTCFNFEVPPADRMRLLEGLDDIGLSLKLESDIVAWEKRTAKEMPWMQRARPQ